MPNIIDRRFRRVANSLNSYGEEYRNTDGKVTPYHILFKDYGDQISAMEKEDALQFISEKVNEFQSSFGGDEQYNYISDEMVDELLNVCGQAQDGMGVLFKIKDFLLTSEDNAIVSSIDIILKHPRTANKVASIISTMLKAHNTSIESKRSNKKI